MRISPLIAALALSALQTSLPVHAMGRKEEPTQIYLKPGQGCWRYHGRASYFTGYFHAGRIVATSTGESHGTAAWATTGPRTVEIFTGKKFAEIQPDASGAVTLPVSGRYDIFVGPESVVGWPGELIVCALA